MFSNVYQKLKRFKFQYIGLDAGYKTPAIAKEIIDDIKIPLMPYTRPKNKNYDFEYNSYYDYYTCPNGNILEHTTTNRLGYKQYSSNTNMCKLCPNYKECILSSQNKKTMYRHLWQNYLDEVHGLRHTKIWKKLYPLRSQTIERVFASIKKKTIKCFNFLIVFSLKMQLCIL